MECVSRDFRLEHNGRLLLFGPEMTPEEIVAEIRRQAVSQAQHERESLAPQPLAKKRRRGRKHD
jgi:hypothetical protein